MELTYDAAFDIGAFKYPKFYDWALMDKDFPYKRFFKISASGQFGKVGTLGELNENYFSTPELKLSYLRGTAFELGKMDTNRVTIQYANSYKSRERFLKWFMEVMAKKMEGIFFTLKTFEYVGTIPNTPGIEICADSPIILLLMKRDLND